MKIKMLFVFWVRYFVTLCVFSQFMICFHWKKVFSTWGPFCHWFHHCRFQNNCSIFLQSCLSQNQKRNLHFLTSLNDGYLKYFHFFQLSQHQCLWLTKEFSYLSLPISLFSHRTWCELPLKHSKFSGSLLKKNHHLILTSIDQLKPLEHNVLHFRPNCSAQSFFKKMNFGSIRKGLYCLHVLEGFLEPSNSFTQVLDGFDSVHNLELFCSHWLILPIANHFMYLTLTRWRFILFLGVFSW